MEMNEELIRKVAQAVLKQMQNGGNAASDPKEMCIRDRVISPDSVNRNWFEMPTD